MRGGREGEGWGERWRGQRKGDGRSNHATPPLAAPLPILTTALMLATLLLSAPSARLPDPDTCDPTPDTPDTTDSARDMRWAPRQATSTGRGSTPRACVGEGWERMLLVWTRVG